MVISYKYRNFGIFLLRLGIGLTFILIYGWQKITAGPDLWTQIGSAMGNVGIAFAPGFWEFLSAFAEFGCSILLIAGLLTRPAAFLLAFNMLIAMTYHFSRLDPWTTIAHPLQLFIVFASLIFIGAGKFSLDYYLSRKSKHSVKPHGKLKDEPEHQPMHMEWPVKVEEKDAVHHL